jgi:hypothetical protein
MAKKPAKAAYNTKTKTQPKKTKVCFVCQGTMEWARLAGKGGKGMAFVCNKCGQVDKL